MNGGPSAHEQLTRTHPAPASPWPLPRPSGTAPYRLRLAEVLSANEIEAIPRSGALRDLFGEEANYRAQFLEPYAGYGAPIFAIAGNHDGDLAQGAQATTLDAFVKHFCGPTASDLTRRTVPQPNVYWTLQHDWVTIIGLYTNVPEGGLIEPDQGHWLTGELAAAPPGVTLILAMHHPVYSADTAHGSNLRLGALLDECFETAGRIPDAVFSAHVHNYQRFTRSHHGREIPLRGRRERWL